MGTTLEAVAVRFIFVVSGKLALLVAFSDAPGVASGTGLGDIDGRELWLVGSLVK